MNSFPAFPQSSALVGILGVAFDENSSWKRGSALAPPKIRGAFFNPSSNLWTENGMTAMVAAKFFKEISAKMLERQL
jgi:arginase family enzyme